MRKAFLHPVTGVLKCHGYVKTNEPGDVAMPVDDDFSLEPFKHRWNGNSWENYSQPKAQTQIDREAAIADNGISALKAMTPDQARMWVQSNVNSLAEAKSLLSTMAATICVLARRI